MKLVTFRTIAIEEKHFEHRDNRTIVIFYEFRWCGLRNYKKARIGKDQQTKQQHLSIIMTACSNIF